MRFVASASVELRRNPTTGTAGCCTRAESGDATADPAITLMKSRRRIAFLEAWDHASYAITAGIYDRRNGLQPPFCVATILRTECPLWVNNVRFTPESGHSS